MRPTRRVGSALTALCLLLGVVPALHAADKGLWAFKPPSLRGAAARPPYMHAGQISTLDEVIAHYATAPEAPEGHSELRPKDFTDKDRAQIVAFLATFDPMHPDLEQIAAAGSQAGPSRNQTAEQSSPCMIRSE